MMVFEPEKRLLEGKLGVLVEYELEYPVLPGPAGRYLTELARRQARQAKALLPGAEMLRRRQGGGFVPHRLAGTVTVTYLSESLVSAEGELTACRGLLGTDRRRWSVTLDRSTGRPQPLSALLARPIPKDLVWACITAQCQDMNRDGCSLYADWRRRIRTGFSPDRYFLTDDGLALWYPWLALGPACTGAPTFLLPYDRIRSYLRRPLS